MEKILIVALNKVDAIEDYRSVLGKYLFDEMKKIEKQSREGFLIGAYLDALIEEVDIEKEEETMKKELIKAKRLTDKYLEIIEMDKENKIVIYKNRKGRRQINIKKDTENISKIVSRTAMFYNSLLINLIIEFENCMSNIFLYYINKYPNAYLKEEKIKYVNISSIDDVEEIKNIIKRKHVDKIMRENILEWLKILEEKHKIHLNVNNETKEKFLEAYYRRNLVVHNELIVNNEYLENIPVSIKKPKINEKLRIDNDYIKDIIKIEKKVIINLLYNIDVKENATKCDVLEALNDYAYNCMLKEDWETSMYVYNIVKEDKRKYTQEKLYDQINYWQSMKRLGRFAEIKKEIEELDISAYEKIYKLAKEILLEENKIALKTLESIYNKENGITATDLEEWPLFIEFRKTEEYKSFKEKYKEDFLEKEKNTGAKKEIKELIQELEENS